MVVTVENPLDLLESAGLVTLFSRDPELEYSFKHSLMQETAYATLVRSRRMELHRQVAEVLEAMQLSPDVAAPILALHFKEAGLPEQAFPYAAQAGDLARSRYASAEALAHYDLALSLVPRLPDEGLSAKLRGVYSGRGTILEVAGRHQEAQDNYEAMRREAARLGDDAMQAEALNRLATVKTVTFDSADAAELLRQALELAEHSRDLPMIARTLWNQGLYYRFHEPDKATDYFEKALNIVRRPDCQALDDSSGIHELEGFILADQRVTHLVAGQFRLAKAGGERALAIFRSLGNRAMVADLLGGSAIMSLYSGQPEAAIQFSNEGIEISRSIGNPWGIVYNSWAQLDIAFDRGQLDEARDRALSLLETARQVAFPIFSGVIHSLLTRLYVYVGLSERALEHARAGQQMFASPAARVSWSIWESGMLGLAHLARGDIAQAGKPLEPLLAVQEGVVPGFQGYFVAAPAVLEYALASGQHDRGLAFAGWILDRFEEQNMVRAVPETLFWRGRLNLAMGDHGAAISEFDRARVGIKALPIMTLEWKNEFFRAAALEAAGQPEEAAAGRDLARSMAQEVARRIESADLREGFASVVAATFGKSPDPLSAGTSPA